jgi:hypothetical protein
MGTTLDVIDFGTGERFTTDDPFVIGLLRRGFQAQEEAAAVYVAASALTRDFNAVRRALAANGWIRTRRPLSRRTGRPNRRRLLIHAADWFEHLRRQGTTLDPLDLPGPMADRLLAAAAEIKQRTAEIRRPKGG